MIDKIKIIKEIKLDTELFSEKLRYKEETKIHENTGEVYTLKGFYYSHNGIFIKYSAEHEKLTLSGRLPNLLITRDRVHNLDDYLIGVEKVVGAEEIVIKELSLTEQHEQAIYDEDLRDNIFPEAVVTDVEIITVDKSLNDLIKEANNLLFELTGTSLDVRDFKVITAEITFNIETPYVKEYITMFNLVFSKKEPGQYTNYVLKNDKELHTSFYVKSNANYRDKTNRSFTINFYNKENQLEHIKQVRNINVTSEDLSLAKKILRLELMQGYTDLKKSSRRFGDFLDIEIAKNKIVQKYEKFIGDKDVDFYSYQEAKQIVQSAPITKEFSATKKRNLLNQMLQQSQGAKWDDYQKARAYRKKLASFGIHWCFIPKQWGIAHLESPMKLLKSKVEQIRDIEQKRVDEASKYVVIPPVQQAKSSLDDFPF